MRINLFIAIALLVFSPLVNIISAQSSLQVNIKNLRNNKGHVLISLFNSGEGFPDDPSKAFRKAKILIIEKKAEIVFSSIPPGTYAIAILHDENDDLEMNTNWIGLPREGYGFSNNVMGTFGPPSFKKAGFPFDDKSLVLEIRTRY